MFPYNLAIEALANDCSEHDGCSLPLCTVNPQRFNDFLLSRCVIGLNRRCDQGHCWCNAILRQQKVTAHQQKLSLNSKDAVFFFIQFRGRIIQKVRSTSGFTTHIHSILRIRDAAFSNSKYFHECGPFKQQNWDFLKLYRTDGTIHEEKNYISDICWSSTEIALHQMWVHQTFKWNGRWHNYDY